MVFTRDCEGHLELDHPTIARKFPGAFSSVPLPKTLPPIPEGPPRPDKGGPFKICVPQDCVAAGFGFGKVC